MYDSRTDKAHSQNGDRLGCRCDYCLPAIRRVRSNDERVAIDNALADDNPQVQTVIDRARAERARRDAAQRQTIGTRASRVIEGIDARGRVTRSLLTERTAVFVDENLPLHKMAARRTV